MKQYFVNDILNKKATNFFAVLFLSLINFAVYAGDGARKSTVSVTPFVGRTSTPTTNAFATNVFTTLTYAAGIETSKKIVNVITLSINEESKVFIPNAFSQPVNVEIKYKTHTTDANYTIVNTTLTVGYNSQAGQTYKAADYITYTDKEEVVVTILSTVPPISGTTFDPFDVLKLTNEMRETRYYTLNTTPTFTSTGTPAFTAITTPSTAIAADIVNFHWSWADNTNNNATQLEWIWVEDDVLPVYNLTTTSSSTDKAILFNRGATRIDLDYNKNSFNIPLLYDGIGRIYARVRAVNFDDDGNRNDAPWSTVYEHTPFFYKGFDGITTIYNGHHPDLNWQATTTFAEEGKSKTVISYFDGSLRSRQTVTKDNELNKTVTAETMYDLQGRPTIQILPTPGIDGILRYQQDLNRFNGQTSMTDDPAKQFDLAVAPAALLTNNIVNGHAQGSAHYYSQNNTAGNPNIPNADGFPYTITRFTPDATGRIQEQTGVGGSHQIGSGHTTKYYYGMPAQKELDALFGTEVGDNTHYSKNMVKDANGQVSVSYVDMHGRTIATALAGDKPDNLKSLVSNGSLGSITDDLIKDDKSNNIVKGNKIENVSTLLVSSPTTLVFDYALDAQFFTTPSCSTNVNFCYECLYDLEFAIKNESDEDVTRSPIILQFSKISLAPPAGYNSGGQDSCKHNQFNIDSVKKTVPLGINVNDVTCSITGNNIHFTIPQSYVEIGSYSIRKTLTLNEETIKNYKDEYAKKDTCRTLQHLIDSMYQVVKTVTGCGTTPPTAEQNCQNCLTALALFKSNYIASLKPGITPIPDINTLPIATQNDINNAYEAQKASCDKLCGRTAQTLPSIRERMLADMMPYTGQYAKNPDPLALPALPAYFTNSPDKLSILNTYNIFAAPTGVTGKPIYKNPTIPNQATITKDFYYDDLGKVDLSVHTDPANQYDLLNTFTNDDFKNAFARSWANSLLPYHPEYKKLVFSETYLQNIYDFGLKIQNTNQWADAASSTNNYIALPGVVATPIDNLFQPLVNLTPVATAGVFADMDTKANTNYFSSSTPTNGQLSMWQLAYGDLFCKDIEPLVVTSAERTNCFSNAPKKPGAIINFAYSYTGVVGSINYFTISDVQKDKVWNKFKSLYLAERNKMILSYLSTRTDLNKADCEKIASLNDGNLTNPQNLYRLQFALSDDQQAQQVGFNDWWIQNGGNTTGPSGAGGTAIAAGSGATIQNAYDSKCESYIYMWKQQLLQCPTIAALSETDRNTLLTDITTKMKTVCVLGSDAQNPYGSSNVKPGTGLSLTYKNFEDIITQAFAAHNLPIGITNLCNPYIIEWPKPYGKGPVMTADVSDKVDSCNCAQFDKIRIEAATHNVSTTNLTALNAYLQTTYGESISQTLFDALQRCSTLLTNVCVTRYDTILYNKCKESDPCGIYRASSHINSTVTNNINYLDSPTLFKPIAFKRMKTLESINEPKDSKLLARNNQYRCQELTDFADAFIRDNDFGEEYKRCREEFVIAFNQQFGTNLEYLEIIHIFKENCCIMPTLCGPNYDCRDVLDPILIEYYTTYGSEVVDNCKQNFVDFFNSKFPDEYPRLTWDEIADLFLTNCNRPLRVCLPYIECGILLEIAQRDLPENTIDCKRDFVDYFNHNQWQDFNPEYTWEEIVEIYRNSECEMPRLCPQQYECEDLNTAIEVFHNNYNGIEENANCESLFVNFFNCYFNVYPRISWREIIEIYKNCDLSERLEHVCSGLPQVDCSLLIRIVSVFENSQTTVTNSDSCQYNFEQYFNYYIRTYISGYLNPYHWYTYSELVDIYNSSECAHLPSCVPEINCTNLSKLETQFLSIHQNDNVKDAVCKAQFIQYFNNIFQVRPSIANWVDMLNIYLTHGCTPPNLCNCDDTCYRPHQVCHTAYQGSILLSLPTTIPQFLKCGGGSSMRCLSCNDIVTLTIGYKNTIPASWAAAPIIKSGILSQADIDANTLFAKYLNYQSGLQFTWMEYLKAIQNASCQIYFSPRIVEIPGSGGEQIGGGSGTLEPTLTSPPEVHTTMNQPQNVICGTSKPLTVAPANNDNPCQSSYNTAVNIATNMYDNLIETHLAGMENSYRAKCLGAKNLETFSVTYSNKEYHYTLYYYDQAGSLVKTVPPAGVDKKTDATFLTNVANERKSPTGAAYLPNHRLTTNYRYNTLNQVIAQNTPDAGTSHFWYDALGRLVVSQNAQQLVTPTSTGLGSNYSYTLYDNLGRISEVGQIPHTTAMTQDICRDKVALDGWLKKLDLSNSGGADYLTDNLDNANQVTRTEYDLPFFQGSGTLCVTTGYLCQQNVRNRVSFSAVFDKISQVGDHQNQPGCHQSATYYSYDIHGNVNILVQDFGSGNKNGPTGNLCFTPTRNAMNYNGIGGESLNRFKKITYDYDLISGKVNQVNYQQDYADQFYHRYRYDAENRLTCVETSHDAIYWERDAKYKYYQHGPLQRTILGQQQVQGIDYAYTIQGWLKGVNTNYIMTAPATTTFDMGDDGTLKPPVNGEPSVNPVAKDVFGFTLNYFGKDNLGNGGDYNPIGVGRSGFNNPFANVVAATTLFSNGTGKDLFNGNIGSMLVNIPSLTTVSGGTAGDAILYGYQYDQLNRITNMNAHIVPSPSTGNQNLVNLQPTDKYKEVVSYDANGNILTYQRNGDNASSLSMDEMTYGYNKDAQGNIINNKLRHVKDAIGDANYTADIDNQSDDNYEYDAIGNLVIDKAEGIYNPASGHQHDPMIEWTVYGKIAKITKKKYVGASLQTTVIKYTYDARGNRISKIVTPPSGAAKETWYVRDATGNVMSIYEKNTNATTTSLTQTEVHLYGSSRLGVFNINRNVQTLTLAATGTSSYTRGNKFFELSNHLGNVLVTITDKKTQIADASGNIIAYYEADIVTAIDYYPLGMPMPGRKYTAPSASEHRYGFNGQEKSDEIGDGLTTALFWEYDSRIGRRWNMDPVLKTAESPYMCFSGNPILNADPLGDDAVTGNSKGDRSMRKYQRKFNRLQRQNPTMTPPQLHLRMSQLYNNKSWMWVKSKREDEAYHPNNPNGDNYYHAGQLVRYNNQLAQRAATPAPAPIQLTGVGGVTGVAMGGVNYALFNVFAFPAGATGTGTVSLNITTSSSGLSGVVAQGTNSIPQIQAAAVPPSLNGTVTNPVTNLSPINLSPSATPQVLPPIINVNPANGQFIYVAANLVNPVGAGTIPIVSPPTFTTPIPALSVPLPYPVRPGGNKWREIAAGYLANPRP